MKITTPQNNNLAKEGKYPHQFWVLFIGQMISVSGVSMVFPFMTIYLREQLQVPLTTITGLIGIESIMTILSTLLVGPIMDRFGRKRVMVVSLLINGVAFYLLTIAETLPQFAALSILRGFFSPLFRVGTNTMVIDLIPKEKLTDAFSLTRTSSNVGFAIGPAIGGFIAVSSFKISLYIGAATMGIIFVLAALLLKETLPKNTQTTQTNQIPTGYGTILKDRPFLIFLFGDTLVKMGMIMMFSLLAIYAKENFGVPESQYGFIMTVNAGMAATLQYAATQFTKRRPPSLMLALGAVFYAAGLGSVALGSQFFHFIISMVIMTIGELILMPTAMTMVAAISPVDMRGRYMSLYSLTMGAAKGLGPLTGGVLNDQIAPVAIWIGAMIMALLSACVFLLLYRFVKIREVQRAALNS